MRGCAGASRTRNPELYLAPWYTSREEARDKSTPKMLSLLVIIFLIELAVQAINTIGATTINSMVLCKPGPSSPSLVVADFCLSLHSSGPS